jgi:hypothetical protein
MQTALVQACRVHIQHSARARTQCITKTDAVHPNKRLEQPARRLYVHCVPERTDMNTHLTHFKLPGRGFRSLIDLTAEGLGRNEPAGGSVVLLQIVVGALLMLGVALIGMQV